MRSAVRLVLVAVAGLVLGMVSLLGLQGTPPAVSAPPRTTGGPAPGPAAAHPVASPARPRPAPAPEAAQELLLVWTSGRLPEGLPAAIAQLPRVSATTVVHGGMVELTATFDAEGRPVEQLPGGSVVPLDALAVDPSTYGRFVAPSARAALTGLRPGHALLGATSARLRGLGAGGTVALSDGTTLQVAGVVDDEAVGAAEIVVSSGASPVLPAARYVLVAYEGGRAAIEQAVRALAPEVSMRLRTAGEVPYLRHGDAVVPQALLKDRFGEFHYRRGEGRDIVQDPAWAAEHIVSADVPLLGTVHCHRAIVDALEGALRELAERNLGHLIDTAGYAGCHNPRLTTSLESVSRHAWGVALDLNVRDNPAGQISAQDDRLVEVFERWGFAWGGDWLVPDPAHFEYLTPPAE